MRKKTKQPVDVANIKNAWQEFFNQNKTYEKEELRDKGWIDVYEIAENLKLSIGGATHRMRKLKVDKKIFSVVSDNSVRQIIFYRLK